LAQPSRKMDAFDAVDFELLSSLLWVLSQR